MEEQKASVAAQTEIPVSSLPPQGESKSKLPKVDKKILIGGGIILILIIIFSSFFIFGKNTSKQPSKLSQEYNAAFSKGDYTKSEEIIKKELASNKTNAQLNAGLVMSIASQGNQTGTEKKSLEQSKPFIEQALKSAPDDLSVLISVGYAYETAGDFEKALEYYKKATELYPNSSEAWFHYGHVYSFLNQPDKSKNAYDKSLSLDPNNSLSLIAKGNEYFSKNDLNNAYQSYSQASDNAPTQPIKSDALTSMSVIKRSQYQLEDAVKLAKQAVDTNPNSSPALGAYGFSLVLTKRVDEGIDYLNKAIEANPIITRNYIQLAQALRLQGKFSEAIELQKKAISQVDNDNTLIGDTTKKALKAAYTYDLAKTYWKSNSEVDVIPVLQEAVTLNPALGVIIKNEHERYGFFNQYSDNQQFNQIINTI